jgi:glycosyltransferase involved in cell wall biosynthesis
MAQAPPLISVVIPMLNEQSYIEKCLRAILANDLDPSAYEVIVVDSGSIDGCFAIAEQVGKSFSSFRLLSNTRRVIPFAMNLGIKHASGKYILRLDAHSECSHEYLRNCIEELRATGAWNVGGTWSVRPGGNTYLAQAIALLVQHPFGVGNASYRLGGAGYVDTVPFGAFPREVFDRIGLYREDLPVHEDYELNARIRRAGGRIYLSPKIHAVYHHPAALSDALRKAWRYGYWDAISWKLYPYCFAWRHALPLFMVLAAILLGMAAIWTSMALKTLAVLGAAYVILALFAAAQLARAHGWRFFPALPALFAMRHAVFGIGSLAGLMMPGKKRSCSQ